MVIDQQKIIKFRLEIETESELMSEIKHTGRERDVQMRIMSMLLLIKRPSAI